MTPIIFIILDGAGEGIAMRGTPLALADFSFPGLKKFGGKLDVIGTGWAPESHSGVLNLLGNRLLPDEVPRGPIEALGIGMDVRDGDIILRANFGTLDPFSGRVVERRVCREISTAKAEQLCSLIEATPPAGLPFELEMCATRDYRTALRLRAKDGSPLDARISNTDPAYPQEGHEVYSEDGYDPIECHPLVNNEAAVRTAEFVNLAVEFCQRRLDTKEAKIIQAGQSALATTVLTRGPGSKLPSVPRLADRLGGDVLVIAESHIERGIAKLLGCEIEMVSGQAGEVFYSQALGLAKERVAQGGSAIIHLKGPDEYGHDGDSDGKTTCLRLIRDEFLQPLIEMAHTSHVIVVTSDHCTPCHARRHTDDPVPFVIVGRRVGFSNVTALSESACEQGIYLRSGADLFELVQLVALSG